MTSVPVILFIPHNKKKSALLLIVLIRLLGSTTHFEYNFSDHILVTSLPPETMGWPKGLYSFFCKIKDTFFICTNNFLELDILSMSAIFCMIYNIDCSQLMSWFDCYQLQLVYLTVEHHPARNPRHDIWQTTFDTYSVTAPSPYAAQIFFVCFLHLSCVFIFLERVEHDMLKLLHILVHLQY